MTASPAATDAAVSSIEDRLGRFHLFDSMTPEIRRTLAEHTVEQVVAAGTIIITEGERSTVLYLIEEGTVEIYRPGTTTQGEYRLLDLTEGQTLGEMAMIDGQPRSASARAGTECRMLVIDPEGLTALPNSNHLLAELKACLSTPVVQRIRVNTDNHVKVLEREVIAAKERQLFGQFFVYMIAIMCIGSIANELITTQLLKINIYTSQFSWGYLVILLIPSVLVMWRMGISPPDLGVTRVGLRRSTIEGAVMSVILVLGALVLRQILVATGAHTGKALDFDIAGALPYLFHSFLQELVARGFMQNSFQRFLDDKKGIKAAVITAILFGIGHMHFGLTAVLITIVSSIIFGLLYLRHKNLAGVTLVHYFAGVAAFLSGLL